MAVTVTPQATPSNLQLYSNTSVANTAVSVNGSATTVYRIHLDNSANAAVTYYKFWNTASGSVTVGTTAPDMIIPVAASSVVNYGVQPSIAEFSTALTIAAVTTAGTAGTTSPTSAAKIYIEFA